MRKARYFISLFVLSLSLNDRVVGRDSPFFQNLKMGSFRVGFRVSQLYDHSRVYLSLSGKGGASRPVQILIWYPATKAQNSVRMCLEDYVQLYITEDNFQEPTRAEQDENIKLWSSIFPKADDSQINPLKIQTRAVKDAQFATGHFPLIVYGAGAEGEAFENFILCEYLASHGYFVAASPSIGPRSHKIPINPAGLETQIRDMEYVIGHLNDFPGIDDDRLAVMGWSWGGLAALLLQMRNSNVDAVLSLDGAIALHEDKAERSPFFDMARMRVPYLFLSTEGALDELTRFFKKIKYSNAYLLGFQHLSHNDFNSYNYVIHSMNSNGADDDIQKKRIGIEWICRYALHFFNASLKNDRKSNDFLDKSAKAENDALVCFLKREAFPPPPTEEAFFEMIEKEGFNKAYQVYIEAKSRDPGVVLFDESSLTDLAFIYYNDLVREEEAIRMMQLNIEAFPESHKSHGYLGRLYEKNNEWKHALVYFSMAYGLALKSDIKPLKDMAWYQKKIEQLKDKL